MSNRKLARASLAYGMARQGAKDAKARRQKAFHKALEGFTGAATEAIPESFPPAVRGWVLVVRELAASSARLELVRLALFPTARADAISMLDFLVQKHMNVKVLDPWSAFFAHCEKYAEILPLSVRQAVTDYKIVRDAYQRQQRLLVRRCRLDNSGENAEERKQRREQRDAFLRAHCKIIRVKKVDEAYPPPQHWLYENAEIGEKWQTYCKDRVLKDKREGYFPMCQVDASRIQHTVKEDASELLVDADTGDLVAVVIRSWCEDARVVRAISDYIEETHALKRSARVGPMQTSHVLSF